MGFLVGGDSGRVLVFEEDRKEGGGAARDVYTLTRVVRVFAVDLVELKPAEGSDYRWVGGWGDG